MTELNPTPTEEKFPAEDSARDGVTNMSEMKQSIPKDDHINIDRVFWGAVILTIVGISSFALGIFMIIQEPVWQVYGVGLIAAISMLINIACVVLIRRGRTAFSLKLLFLSGLVTITLNTILLTNVTALLIGFMLLVSLGEIFLLFPKSWRNRALLGPVVALAIMLLVEYLDPSFRLDYISELPFFGQTMMAFMVVAFIVVILRQAWSGNLRAKLLAAFIGVTVVATGVLGAYMITTSSNNLQENLERELAAATVDRASRIGDLFNEQVNALTTLSLNEALLQALEAQNSSYEGSTAAIQATLDAKDAQWRAADEADNNNDPLVRANLTNNVAREVTKYKKVFPANVEVFITDAYGGLAGTTNRTSDYFQADEGWWQAAYNDGEGAVYIGDPEFDESAGAIGVNIALPLRNQDTGEITGILRTTYIVTPLTTILGEKVGETGEADIYFPGETVTHIHEGEFGPAEAEEFEALQAVFGQGLVEMEYEGTQSVVSQAQVQTLAGNPAVDNLGWVVVLHQQQQEALAPVTAATQGFVIVLLIVVALAAAAAFFGAQYLVRPILRLTSTAEEVSAGNLNSRAEVTTSDEVGTLATAFNTMTSQLQEILQGLEQRVAARTQNLELAAEVGRSVSQVRALDVMLRDACQLILDEFDLYYVQVYLTDPSKTNLVLEAGTGDVGVQLLGRGHSLPLNTGSINGRAAVERQTVVISDTAESTTFRPNPLLPDTRGEMAVPLIVGENVVGVLDMQTTVPGALTEEVLPAFEALAGQVAVAVQNATLVAEAEQARAEVEAQARRLVRAGWDEHLDAIHKPERLGFVFDRKEVKPLTEEDISQLPEDGRSISAPISLTGEALGSLEVEIEDESQSERTTELVNIISRQVAQQLENLRLLESAERFRQEAEKAARLQTIEGWQQYIASRTTDSLGYLYDLKEVRPHGDRQDDAEALTLPVKAREETVGKLSVQGLAPDDQESFELANAVAERLGAHIENLRLFEETRRGQVELDKRARQLAAVAQVSTASSQEMDVQRMLETVVHLTQRQFGLYHAHVFTYNEATEELAIVACGYREGDEHEGTHGTSVIPLAQEQSLVARAARTKQAIIVNDVLNEPGWLPNPLLPETRAELAVPMVVGDQLLGVLDVQSENLNHFTEEDANIQSTLASQVAIALQNAYSFAQAQKQAERESLLNTINQKIQSATSVEQVLQIAARELGHALGAPMTIAQLSMQDRN